MSSACASLAGSPALSAIADASFGLFLGALRLAASPQGVFLSPLSIVYALVLALNGAGPDSPTHTELLGAITNSSIATGWQQQQQQAGAKGLSESQLNSNLSAAMTSLIGQCGAGPMQGPGSEVVLANSLWTRGTQLKTAYVKSMKSLFQATAAEAVHGAADINAWVSDATRGLITDLIRTNDFDAVLANALYFKGLWEHPFKPELTKPRGFTTSSGETKQVDMMQQLFKNLGISVAQRAGLYDAVALPYMNGTFSAVALLPAQGVDMVAALRGWSALNELQGLEQWDSVRVTMPKFKVRSSMSLAPVLKNLGVRAAFNPRAANFSRLADSPLFISDVLHEAVVEVDEKGTVAAAATAVMMLTAVAMEPAPLELVFDRPFAFLIYHNPTGLPVFTGEVNDPSAAA